MRYRAKGFSLSACLTVLIAVGTAFYFFLYSKSSVVANQGKSTDKVWSQALSNWTSISDLLGVIATSKFPEKAPDFRKDSINFYGDQSKLDYGLLNAFANTRKLRIGLIGGSISVPRGIKKEEGFFSRFCYWLAKPLAEYSIDLICDDAAIGATFSEYFALCINEHLDLSFYDIIFIESAVNDDVTKGYPGYTPNRGRPLEELVRAIWRKNPLIHIVLVNFISLPWLFKRQPIQCDSIADHEYQDVAKRYQITSLQWKHIFCNDQLLLRPSRIHPQQLLELGSALWASDGYHPNSIIHDFAAEFLVGYFRKVVINLMKRLETFEHSSALGKILMTTQRLAYGDPLYADTWFDHSECFVSYNRPYRQNDRLIGSIVNASEEITDNIKTDRDLSDVFDRIQIIRIPKAEPNNPNFVRFQLYNSIDRIPCPSGEAKGYLPRLAFAYWMCNCTTGDVNFQATFHLTDGTKVTSDYKNVQLVSTGYKINYVQILEPAISDIAKFCRSDVAAIDSVELWLIHKAQKYQMMLDALMIIYDCGCKTLNHPSKTGLSLL